MAAHFDVEDGAYRFFAFISDRNTSSGVAPTVTIQCDNGVEAHGEFTVDEVKDIIHGLKTLIGES